MPIDPSVAKHVIGYGITGTSGITGTTVASVKYNSSVSSNAPLTDENNNLKNRVKEMAQFCVGVTNVFGNSFSGGVTNPSSGSGIKKFDDELFNLKDSCTSLVDNPNSDNIWSLYSHDISKLKEKMGGKHEGSPTIFNNKTVNRLVVGNS